MSSMSSSSSEEEGEEEGSSGAEGLVKREVTSSLREVVTLWRDSSRRRWNRASLSLASRCKELTSWRSSRNVSRKAASSCRATSEEEGPVGGRTEVTGLERADVGMKVGTEVGRCPDKGRGAGAPLVEGMDI